jgi:hypothetical protein
MSDTLLAWASKLPISAASFVGSLQINLQQAIMWWGEAILFALGLDYFFVSSFILTVFAYAQSAVVHMAAFILCLVWSVFCLICCLINGFTPTGGTPRHVQSPQAPIYAISMPTLIQITMATEDLNLRSVFAKCMKLEEVLERTWPAIGVELLLGVVIAHALMSCVHALTCHVLIRLLCMSSMICLRP